MPIQNSIAVGLLRVEIDAELAAARRYYTPRPGFAFPNLEKSTSVL